MKLAGVALVALVALVAAAPAGAEPSAPRVLLPAQGELTIEGLVGGENVWLVDLSLAYVHDLRRTGDWRPFVGVGAIGGLGQIHDYEQETRSWQHARLAQVGPELRLGIAAGRRLAYLRWVVRLAPVWIDPADTDGAWGGRIGIGLAAPTLGYDEIGAGGPLSALYLFLPTVFELTVHRVGGATRAGGTIGFGF